MNFLRAPLVALVFAFEVHSESNLRASVNEVDLKSNFITNGGDEQLMVALGDQLEPFWNAMPKNGKGFLELNVARYVLHRLFVHRHGWYIHGLQPKGDFWKGTAPEAELSEWVPKYMLSNTGQLLGERGIDFKDLLILGASLEHQIRDEARNMTKNLLEVMEWYEWDQIPMSTAHRLLRLYTSGFLSGRVWNATQTIHSSETYIRKYVDWYRTESWYMGVVKEFLPEHEEVTNLNAIVQSVLAIGENYGTFNDVQCRELKTLFVGSWPKAKATGRVRMADFYRLGLTDTQWWLNENAAGLEKLGALDSSQNPNMVVIPNYITSTAQCLRTTRHITVCCRNECEDLMQILETKLKSPTVPADRIVEEVRYMTSDTVSAPRELDPLLMKRLQEIAVRHGGDIHLHGRLFAQWMHHVFPNECPNPMQVSNSSHALTHDSWIPETATTLEMRQIVDDSCSPEEAAELWSGEVSWSDQEFLLSSVAHQSMEGGHGGALSGFSSTAICMLLAVLIAATQIPKARQRLGLWAPKSERAVILVAFCVATAAGLVNGMILVVVVVVAVPLQMAQLGKAKPAKKFDDDVFV